MKKIALYFIILFVLISCELKVKQIPQPSNLIEKQQMIDIIEELMLVEDQIQTRYLQFDKFQKSAEKSGDHILKKHKISYKNFATSFDYYASRQDEMKGIYNRVLENLSKKLTTLQNE